MNSSGGNLPRIKELQDEMVKKGVDLVAIGPTVNMRYLIGFTPIADERPCTLLISQNAVSFVVPELNADQVEAHTGLKTLRWKDEDGPVAAYRQAQSAIGNIAINLLAVDNLMRAEYLLLIHELLHPQKMIAAEQLLSEMRICKNEEEIEMLAKSAALADRALLVGVDACQPGLTEREVAEVINSYFRKNGVDFVDFVLVASGPNGAFPHHDVSDRVLQAGDIVILDIGATLHGYHSDVTRVVSLGEPSEETRIVYDAVRAANLAGRKAAVAGVAARAVDNATRDVIIECGFGPQFKHRTGHGIGLEVHEQPYITSKSDTILKPGMAFSIEPGIYLQDRFGIRIEDIIIVTDGEPRRLTGLPHDMYVK